MDIPPTEYYGGFSQLDDGVGSLRMLLDDFETQQLPAKLKQSLSICFACSVASKTAFERISLKLNSIEGLTTFVMPVKSTYWGEGITVAGLITSADLINTVKNVKTDYVVAPSIMLKPYSDLFLDGVSMKEVVKETGKNFFIPKDNYSLGEVVELIKSYV